MNATTPYTSENARTVVDALNTVGTKSVANATAIENLGDVTEMNRDGTPTPPPTPP